MQDNKLLSLDSVYVTGSEYVGRTRGRSIVSQLYGRKILREKVILEDISLDVCTGDKIALVGSNGAGKSTLLKVLAGIKKPSRGRCHYFTDNHVMLGDHALGFTAAATVRENIIVNGLSKGLPYKKLKDNTRHIMEFAELPDALDRPVQSLSAGQKMRVALGVTLMMDADLYLIDEWIAALDGYFFKKFSTALKKKMIESSGMVVASHNRNMLRQVCNKAIWIDHGQIQKVGGLQEILDAYDEYTAMSNAPQSVS